MLRRVRRFYQLALVDCGPEIEHPVMQTVLSQVDSLIIVGTMNFDGAAAAETTIKWLAARSEYQALLRRSALVLNDVYNCADKDFMAKVRETIGQRVGGVTSIPWDKHLRDSPPSWTGMRCAATPSTPTWVWPRGWRKASVADGRHCGDLGS